jgi:hypothetical protein
MFQILEGRLAWEQTPEGISVEVPARRGALASLYIPMLAIWVVFTWLHHWYEAGKDPSEDLLSMSQAIIVAGIAVGFFFLIGWLAWNFTSQTFLTMSQRELKIQHRVMGIDLVTRSFPTGEIFNLKFIPPASSLSAKSEIDPKTSRLQFQVGKQISSFAAGVTQPEAFALIKKMLEIYPFPAVDSRDIPMPG